LEIHDRRYVIRSHPSYDYTVALSSILHEQHLAVTYSGLGNYQLTQVNNGCDACHSQVIMVAGSVSWDGKAA
jgi:hypothetical protein